MSAVEEIMQREIERLRDQLHLAEVVRAAQVEGLTQGAAGWRERANQLEAEVAGLRAELDARRKSGSASDRLHNICAAVEAEADSSVFSREEWGRIDTENVALRATLRDMQSKLAASLRIPTMPWPDPVAHSHEATGRAIHASFCQLRFAVMDALSTARAALEKAP